jgi:hypothetical protein
VENHKEVIPQTFNKLAHYPSSRLYQKPSCLFFRTQRFGDFITSPKRCILKNKQDGFWIRERRWIMSKNIIFVLMDRHSVAAVPSGPS